MELYEGDVCTKETYLCAYFAFPSFYVFSASLGCFPTLVGAPVIDVVFVHGIRGGPFVTWRIDGVLRRGDAREHLDRSVCWPTAWLAPTIPEARLISAEYAAPASGWEGESLPLQQTADQLARKLVNAGVGHRPVVFVTHSMGGLVVKGIICWVHIVIGCLLFDLLVSHDESLN